MILLLSEALLEAGLNTDGKLGITTLAAADLMTLLIIIIGGQM
jgi:hypothetical protein